MNTMQTIPFALPEGEPLMLDIALPERPNGAALFFVHGGGFAQGWRKRWYDHMAYYRAKGYTCINCGYRGTPGHRFPVPIDDVEAGLVFALERAGRLRFDPAFVVGCGSSAGAHIAIQCASRRPDAFRALLAFCPVVTLHERDYAYRGGPCEFIAPFMGCTERQDPERYRRASPIDTLTGREPPILAVVGERDDITPIPHHRAFRERARSLGGSVELAVIPGVGHGPFYGTTEPHHREALCIAEAFLKRHGVPPS
jgi:acetyl esterase/lipase